MRIVLLALLLASQTVAPSPYRARTVHSTPEWKYLFVFEDDRDTFKAYYDAANLYREKVGSVLVWLKVVPITKTEAERRRFVAGIIDNRKLRMSVSGYERYAYTLSVEEFDCVGRRARSISIEDYDETEKLLGSSTLEDLPFAPATKGSMAEFILKTVCK